MSVELDKDALNLSEEVVNREFVTFLVCNEVFALDMAPVREIVRVPTLVKVPKAPPSLVGIANLRGEVLPIVSLRKVFNLPDKEIDETSRVIVFDIGYMIGFLVDKVLSVIEVEESKIEDSSNVKSIVKSEYLKGVIKDIAGHRMFIILDLDKVLEKEFLKLEVKEKRLESFTKRSEEKETEGFLDEKQFVSFTVGGEEYAISIEDVQEIVQPPEFLMRVPNADSYIVGVMSLRNRILPLASLRSLFGLPEEGIKENNRVIILSTGGLSIGVVVDSVKEVLRIPTSLIEPLPWVLQKENTYVVGVCRLDEGRRLVSIVSVSELFKSRVVKEALSSDGMEKKEEESFVEEEEQVVVFQLDGVEYAVPIVHVQEIVRVPEELTTVPKAPEFVEGVINLRGTVLPIVDLRKRLGLSVVDKDERQRILVLIVNNKPIGFIVDSVSEVLKIPRIYIKDTPRVSVEQARLFKKVANMEKEGRLIQFIEINELLMGEEIKELNCVGEETNEEV